MKMYTIARCLRRWRILYIGLPCVHMLFIYFVVTLLQGDRGIPQASFNLPPILEDSGTSERTSFENNTFSPLTSHSVQNTVYDLCASDLSFGTSRILDEVSTNAEPRDPIVYSVKRVVERPSLLNEEMCTHPDFPSAYLRAPADVFGSWENPCDRNINDPVPCLTLTLPTPVLPSLPTFPSSSSNANVSLLEVPDFFDRPAECVAIVQQVSVQSRCCCAHDSSLDLPKSIKRLRLKIRHACSGSAFVSILRRTILRGTPSISRKTKDKSI